MSYRLGKTVKGQVPGLSMASPSVWPFGFLPTFFTELLMSSWRYPLILLSNILKIKRKDDYHHHYDHLSLARGLKKLNVAPETLALMAEWETCQVRS